MKLKLCYICDMNRVTDTELVCDECKKREFLEDEEDTDPYGIETLETNNFITLAEKVEFSTNNTFSIYEIPCSIIELEDKK